MIRILLLMALIANLMYGNATKYFIKLGSFKNLEGLERHIDTLPTDLRSHIVIVRSSAWYIPFAYYTPNKYALVSKVAAYKRYFKDAHVAYSSSMLKHPLVRSYVVKKKQRPQKAHVAKTYIAPQVRVPNPTYTNLNLPLAKTYPMRQSLLEPLSRRTKIITQKVVIKEPEKDEIFSKAEIKKYKYFTKEMLSGQHYYLVYKKTQANPDLLIKVHFENHEVSYKAIVGDMQMSNAHYIVEDKKLYMFADVFTKNGSFSTLEGHEDKYFLVASWVNGKKLNTLRYYYKLNDAKAYLGLNTSDGLADTLTAGEYDDWFLDE